MDTLNLKELVAGFERNRKALHTALSKLEAEAETIRGQQETREASRARIQSLERKRASLAGERDSLRGEYAEASFEGDQDELERIGDRREQIDEDLTRITEDINAERTALKAHEVDATHAAEIAVQRDMLKPLNVRAFIEKLTESLQAQTDEINKRIGRVGIPSSAYKREDYERIRSGRDSNYAIQLSREKRLAAKEAEKRAKLRPISNTSDMADSMGTRRRPEDRMTVTSKGHTQRVSGDEEADHTQVLSGDEIRKALAEKQARKAG